MTVVATATQRAELVQEYADKIQPLIPLASRAYGSARAGSPPREASDQYNQLLLEYANAGGNMKHLSDALGVSYATLARRIRIARSAQTLGEPFTTRGWGSRDPDVVQACAAQVQEARATSPEAYSKAVRDVHARGVSLYAVAEKIGVSYYALWSAMRR